MTALVSKPAAGAEYAALRAVMSRTGEKFRVLAKDSQVLKDILENPSSFIPPELSKSIQEGGGMLAWAKAIKQDENGKYFFDVRDLPIGESGYVVAHGATAKV
ncbi:hypothetical protein, partial [Klebsiella pneumoniae]|uniref:hypothetical protein n=1 Tax=Klebsiella pneumoniae TaxID=573 RepID=UPI003A7F6315